MSSILFEKGNVQGRSVHLIDFERKIDTFHRLDRINCFKFNIFNWISTFYNVSLFENQYANQYLLFQEVQQRSWKWRNVADTCYWKHTHYDSLRSEISNYAFINSDNEDNNSFSLCQRFYPRLGLWETLVLKIEKADWIVFCIIYMKKEHFLNDKKNHYYKTLNIKHFGSYLKH